MNQFTIDNKIYNDIMKVAAKVVRRGIDAKPALTGVYVEVTPGEVRFTACDGYRLMHYVYSRPGVGQVNDPLEFSFIMPVTPVKRQGKDALVIIEAFIDVTDRMRVSVTDGYTGTTITVNTIKALYIDYRKVYPEIKDPQYIYLDPKLLRDLLEDVGYEPNRHRTIKLAFGSGEQGRAEPMVITNSNDEVHMYNMVLPVRTSAPGCPDESAKYEGRV